MNSPIVITGMGIISPLGCGVKPVWNRLLAGTSGIDLISRFGLEDVPIKIAGLVPDIGQDPDAGFDSAKVVAPKDLKKLDLFTVYAFAWVWCRISLLFTILRLSKRETLLGVRPHLGSNGGAPIPSWGRTPSLVSSGGSFTHPPSGVYCFHVNVSSVSGAFQRVLFTLFFSSSLKISGHTLFRVGLGHAVDSAEALPKLLKTIMTRRNIRTCDVSLPQPVEEKK